MSELCPTTNIQYLKGVGPHIAQLLQKRSVYTAWDLLFHLPSKYVDRRKIHTVRSLPVEKKQNLIATVQKLSVRSIRGRGRRLFEMTVADNTGVAMISFFQFNESWLRKRYPVGQQVLIFGDVRSYKGVKSFTHPDIEIWDDDSDSEYKIQPFYPLTEGLYQKTLRSIILKNLESLLSVVRDDPRSVRSSGEVTVSLTEAFKYVHVPPESADIETLNSKESIYHQRIIYDEFFYLQLGLISKRYQQMQKETFKIINEQNLMREAKTQLPFDLTNDQENAVEDIKNDFSSGKPMNRMIQGDVGSGKTIVCFLSSLLAIESGFQVVLMAPTEILAEQHFKNLFPYEEKLGIRVELLTGSTKTKKRNQILYDLEQGMTNLVIGTHALIEPNVIFHNLGFVIIDEQHRFGVQQRAQLKNKTKLNKNDVSPHLLVMTATPIPRTLSMCVYGDLDLSIIKEMPKGRKPILTKVFREKGREKMYALIAKQLKKGSQTYFVYPLVAESEKMDLKDATDMQKKLSAVFSDYSVALLHGKMKSAEKEKIMSSFKKGDVNVLVATTVVEVGVDVPNATVMVIEHAERFGLSQLHQLRGRVGRGSDRSYCYLMASYAQSEESRFRLKVMEETTDGFVIAEEDLKLRGPGEFLGTKQSGLPDFRLAQIIRDGKLLTAAKKRAEVILEDDPNLQKTQNKLIKEIMLARWEKRLDLSLV